MRVAVTTGCRLHLGFTNLSEDVGRCFGSIGVAVDQPRTTLVLERRSTTGTEAIEQELIRTLVRRFCDYYHLPPEVAIEVRESIPAHVGLGSGTQMALAVGLGLAALFGVEANVRDLSVALGRGKRSGVGTAVFETGGVIIDAGHKIGAAGAGAAPTVVWRHDFPDDWCFVVAVPNVAKGLSGRSENGAFAALSPSVRVSEEICRLTQLCLMPAIVEHDIVGLGAAITAIDRKAGSYFSRVQDGVYNGELAREIIDVMLQAGASGAGQSSWGPAVYGLVHQDDATRLVDAVRAHLRQVGVGGQVFVGRGRNSGTRVDVREGGPARKRPPRSAEAVPWPSRSATAVRPSSRLGSTP